MNDYKNPNLESLVKKVYDEGIEKAKEEAKQIIEDAKQQSAELMAEAEKQIANLKEQSLNEVNRMRENLNSEMKTVAQQTVSTVKNELASIIINRIAIPEISKALKEKEFLEKIIFTLVQKWNPADTNFKFELLLNKDDEAQLKDFFEQRIRKELGVEMEIIIENKIKSGFKIGVKNENYYVSFSDVDFENFFKGYLRTNTLDWIYGKKENEIK